jgi:predicted nucleic acid-binding protein
MADRIVLDSGPLVALARAVGLTVAGTLGLLARARTPGVLSALRPIVERMQARGVWFDEDLVEQVLVPLGE